MSIPIDLAGNVAWVTGGASGIGAAVVSVLRDAGARIVSLDSCYNRDEGDGAVRCARIDVRDSANVTEVGDRLIAEGHAPDILVNNAGISRDSMVWKMTDEQWDDVLQVNLSGVFRMTRACAPIMRSRRRGAIVNIASINAMRGKAGQANYGASKAGIIGFTKTAAAELARDGIRVNAVAPGFIDTPLTAGLPDTVLAEARKEIRLGGELGTPRDVAHAVLFLASPLASHITGEVLVVDGGQLL